MSSTLTPQSLSSPYRNSDLICPVQIYPHQEKYGKVENGRDLVTEMGRGWVRI